MWYICLHQTVVSEPSLSRPGPDLQWHIVHRWTVQTSGHIPIPGEDRSRWDVHGFPPNPLTPWIYPAVPSSADTSSLSRWQSSIPGRRATPSHTHLYGDLGVDDTVPLRLFQVYSLSEMQVTDSGICARGQCKSADFRVGKPPRFIAPRGYKLYLFSHRGLTRGTMEFGLQDAQRS